MKIVPFVLSGGLGSRLWPLSRESFPKQFLSFFDDKSLLQSTFERVAGLADQGVVWAISNDKYRFLVQDAAEASGATYKVLLEPVGRNTAAAMAVAALNAQAEQLLLFIPSDHYIPDISLFAEAIHEGVESAKSGGIVVFGVEPKSPHTGYGYIQIKKENSSKGVVKQVKRFVEKPNTESAAEYLNSDDFYWNMGILLVRGEVLISALDQYAPDILHSARRAVQAQVVDGNFICLDRSEFESCRSESIDYAVLENYHHITMVPFHGKWSDIGSWDTVTSLVDADSNSNRIVGNGRVHGARSTYINSSYRVVVALGTDDLSIIDTADALLVASNSCISQIKDVVADMQEDNVPQAVEHRYTARPWGEYDVIEEGVCYKVKRIVVKPGGRLSLQLHHYRAEHWIVIAGTARVTCGNKIFMMSVNESTFIPVGVKHRLENIDIVPLEIIEVQSGSYLSEDDIERLDDEYGRLSTNK